MLREKRWLYDAVLILLLFSLAAGSLLFLFPREEGRAVEVRIDGELLQVYALDAEGSYALRGRYGSATLVILDGRASLHEAACPDKLCERRGELSKVGESAVCLPSRIEIRIVGEGEVDGYA